MNAFKVEYFHKGEWHEAEYAGSLGVLLAVISKWKAKGYEVRCLNAAGENIA